MNQPAKDIELPLTSLAAEEVEDSLVDGSEFSVVPNVISPNK